MTDTNSVPTFNVVLIGDSAVGKTTYIKKWLTAEFQERYIPTRDLEIRSLRINTTHGEVQFDVWDLTGREEDNWAILNAAFLSAQAAIVMFDVTSRITYDNAASRYFVICGNKVDAPGRKVKAKHITFHWKEKLQYYDISVKSSFHFYKPFLHLIRRLRGNSEIVRKQCNSVFTFLNMESANLRNKEILPISNPVQDSSSSTTENQNLNSHNDEPVPSETAERESEDSTHPFNKLNLKNESDGDDRLTISDEKETSCLSSGPETEELKMFVLCMHCTRMIFIQFTSSARLAGLTTSLPHSSLVVIHCRACDSRVPLERSPSGLNLLSPLFIQSTHMYDCACRISGEKVTVLSKSSIVLMVSIEDLAAKMNADSRVYGVCTSNSTLDRLNELDRESLLLPYLPGAFL